MKLFYYTKYRLSFILTVGVISASLCTPIQAKKIYTGVFGRVYLNSGDSINAHRKELVDNPSTALLFYENFLLSNPPLNDDNSTN